MIGNRRREIPTLAITANLLLLLGGLTLAVTAFFLAGHLTDTMAYSVGLPNFIGGLLMIGSSMIVSKRADSLKKLSSILTKLTNARFTL
jgi:hypothetical protein